MGKVVYRSERPGVLPTESEPVLAGVRLPPGHLICPHQTHGSSPEVIRPGPILWISDRRPPDLDALWLAIASQFSGRGLWPLVLEPLSSESSRPWEAGELDPAAASDPDCIDPQGLLSSWWGEVIPCAVKETGESDESIGPFGAVFPGLAPPVASTDDPAAVSAALALAKGRLGLVGARRPADVVAVLGWQGSMNHCADPGRLAAVLRTWEERFGAIVVAVGFDTLTLAVHRPPCTPEVTHLVAAEHLAFCSDVIYQGPGTLARYAAGIQGQRVWRFWWD